MGTGVLLVAIVLYFQFRIMYRSKESLSSTEPGLLEFIVCIFCVFMIVFFRIFEGSGCLEEDCSLHEQLQQRRRDCEGFLDEES